MPALCAHPETSFAATFTYSLLWCRLPPVLFFVHYLLVTVPTLAIARATTPRMLIISAMPHQLLDLLDKLPVTRSVASKFSEKYQPFTRFRHRFRIIIIVVLLSVCRGNADAHHRRSHEQLFSSLPSTVWPSQSSSQHQAAIAATVSHTAPRTSSPSSRFQTKVFVGTPSIPIVNPSLQRCTGLRLQSLSRNWSVTTTVPLASDEAGARKFTSRRGHVGKMKY